MSPEVPMKQVLPFLFVSVHKGPYLSIQPLEEELGVHKVSYLVEGVSREERTQRGLPYLSLSQVEAHWGSLGGFLREMKVKAIIRSSSEDVLERNVEELISVAAKTIGTPVFVVEDFPGNYRPQPDERLDGLFVEDESMVELHKSRGVDPSVIYTTGNPRYNVLTRLDRREEWSETRNSLGLGDSRVMLWAGQPDGDNSYRALERLLKSFSTERVTLLFRAHPRDRFYTDGEYGSLLANSSMEVLDVSAYPDVVGLYCSSDLVITQFSSAGVEAGYLGVPALFVLFDDLGKEYLRCFKGYEMLTWCNNGCAFLIESEIEIKDVMERAMFDADARDQVRSNFQRRFGARGDCAQAIADRIRTLIGEYMYDQVGCRNQVHAASDTSISPDRGFGKEPRER